MAEVLLQITSMLQQDTVFFNRDGATITADNFNVTAGGDFNNYKSSTINADNFNVSAGDDFFNNQNATINADSFNVSAGDSFYNEARISADTVTIEVTNFADDITNTATISSDSLNFILTDDFTRSSTSFSGFNNFSNLGIITDGRFY